MKFRKSYAVLALVAGILLSSSNPPVFILGAIGLFVAFFLYGVPRAEDIKKIAQQNNNSH